MLLDRICRELLGVLNLEAHEVQTDRTLLPRDYRALRLPCLSVPGSRRPTGLHDRPCEVKYAGAIAPGKGAPDRGKRMSGHQECINICLWPLGDARPPDPDGESASAIKQSFTASQ